MRRPDLNRLLLAAAFAGALHGAQEPDTFRVDTHLVEVDVVVRSKGKPVDGLTEGQFSLFDQGKRQRIAAFSVRRASDRPAARRLADGEVSNRLNGRGEEPVSPTIILLDTLNSDPEDLAETRRQLLLYLERIDYRERIAIYSLNKTLRVVQDFTDDPERLREIVSRWKTESSVDVDAPLFIEDLPLTGDALADGMAEAAAKEMTDAANLNRAEITSFALQLIARHLSGLPGRKKLVWAGASFSARTSEQRSRLGKTQIEIRDYSEFIDKAVRALNEAQVAVYPIDPRNPLKGGLSAPGIETMNLFAGGTGGRAFYLISDIAAAIQDAVEDSSITYVLGFYPEQAKLDGKYHNLRVTVSRSGAEVRHRRGYIAADGKPPEPGGRQKMLRAAIETPLNSTDIGVAARVLPSRLSPQAHEVVVRIDAHDLDLNTEQTKDGITVWCALVTISTFLPEHPRPNGTSHDLKLTFTQRRLAEVLRDGYSLRLLVNDNGAGGRVRVAVQDRASGKTGSLMLRIQ